MRNHIFEKHSDCKLNHCPVCDGGLAICTVCRCGEGSLPTECPGEPVRHHHGQRIYLGWLDFINGTWVALRRSGRVPITKPDDERRHPTAGRAPFPTQFNDKADWGIW